MPAVTGFFLINKPSGITSHDVVDALRLITKEKTIGHAGTLDPLASGLMIVAIGRKFTKRLSEFVKLDKEYIAEATLGATSTTYDEEGVIKNYELKIKKGEPKREEIEKILQGFVGKQEQMPPIFSAKKIKGKKSYDLARSGKLVELKPVKVRIRSINLLRYQYPEISFVVEVSSGTYVRSLAHDIGERLKTGAYLSKLVRTKIGKYPLAQAIDLNLIKSSNDLLNVKIS